MVKIGVHKSRQFETNCEITTILWGYFKKEQKSLKRYAMQWEEIFSTGAALSTILWAYSKKDQKGFKRNTIGWNLFYWSNTFFCHLNHDDYVFMKQLFYKSSMKITAISREPGAQKTWVAPSEMISSNYGTSSSWQKNWLFLPMHKMSIHTLVCSTKTLLVLLVCIKKRRHNVQDAVVAERCIWGHP